MATQVLLLLAEDEPLVSMATQDALEAGGFAVVSAASGEEAMALIESQANEWRG